MPDPAAQDRPDDPDVLAVVTAVADAAARADGADPLDEATRRRLRLHGLAGVTAWTSGEDGFALRYDDALDLVVRRSARGRGLGGALAAQALAPDHRTDDPVGDPTDDREVTAWSHGDDPAAAALARRHGFDRARELWVMRRPTSDPLPDLVVPGGLTVRGYRDTDADEVVRVNAAAFAHHPEQGAMDRADLAARMGEPWFDPAGLLVADTAGGRLAGFHWTKQHDARLGEVYVVGIDPDRQGQGLGKVLTLAGLHHLAGLGVEEIELYVESDNAPAIAVYSRLGFTHVAQDTHVQYRRPGPPHDSGTP